MDIIFSLIPIFFIIALVYSSAGFGGGSSYLALMAILSYPYQLMPSTSLLCNIIVVTGGCCIYYRHGLLKIREILPFIIGSVPMAFIGGNIFIRKEIFILLLGLTLVISAVNMLLFNNRSDKEHETGEKNGSAAGMNRDFEKSGWPAMLAAKIAAGSIIGFISGIVGIGGGILLAPVLYVIKWNDSRKIAAATSFFILINSISGLAGQFIKTDISSDMVLIVPLAAAAFFGGQIGSRLCAGIVPELFIKKAAASIILSAGMRLLFKLI